MCGIAGFIGFKQTATEQAQVLHRMSEAMLHRGPDDGGAWVDAEVGVALGHRRLSIVDLSPHGHQPMHSVCGRYVIVFNGEIYNFQKIRRELEELAAVSSWRGHSDTEVALAAISYWGLGPAVKAFSGMFAFALWDRQERVLHLVRDRLGEKPLYYGSIGDVFLFGSELKALRQHPVWREEINRDALALYMRHNYIPSPYSIYKGIFKLLPGTILSLPVANKTKGCSFSPIPYWSAKGMAENGVRNHFIGTETEAINQLDELLSDSVKQQMVADVPLGAFLSGGIDSSTIVAIMQAHSNRPVKTFTIGFNEEGYNEAVHAKAVARYLGTDHTELYITPEEAMAVIPKLPVLYDEPFSDSSQIPTFLVSKLARQHVTVSLSGDGGDELFAGYSRYFIGQSIWQKIKWMPKEMRKVAAKMLTILSPEQWDAVFGRMENIIPKKLMQKTPGDKLHKLSEVLYVDDPDMIYHRLVSYWKEPDSLVLDAHEPPTLLTQQSNWADLPDFTQRMMYLDLVTYLPDDILVKVDRAAMGVSLESRVPLLDHRVIEFAWRIPLSMKIRNGQGKWLLRQLLYKYMPQELLERPKMGFTVPIDIWLRGPLREWAEALLNERRLRQEGIFNPDPIRKKWLEHLSCKRNWQNHLWSVLMFQAWQEKYE